MTFEKLLNAAASLRDSLKTHYNVNGRAFYNDLIAADELVYNCKQWQRAGSIGTTSEQARKTVIALHGAFACLHFRDCAGAIDCIDFILEDVQCKK